MIGNRICAFTLSATFASICAAPFASAGKFDGSWSMTAVTTRGHCGTIPIGMGDIGRPHSFDRWIYRVLPNFSSVGASRPLGALP